MSKAQSKEKKDKGSKGSKKPAKSEGDNDVKREQKLQAILLADSFSSTFKPITLDTPKVLLPLVNVPMLDMTLEFLSQNNVEEVFIFCVWHADMVKEYVNKSKWPSILSVKCISSKSCFSAGDAVRELDSMGVIRSDPFILISGDVVSNMDLKKAIQFHKDRKKEDNDCMMTVVLKPVQTASRAKPVLDDLVVAMDTATSQILLFDDSLSKNSVSLPVQIMAEHPSLSFRYDLLDCQVDICSPEMLLQFSDNFDYQDIRRDFIRNEAVNWELGMHLYGYILQDEYAARVHDPRTYHSICRDIITRWVYPIVPEAQLLIDGSYSHLRRYVYREKGVRVARTAHIGEGVVIGQDTIIEEHARVERSVIGRGCIIRAGAVITESHLWKGVVVEAGAHVSHSILCDGVTVKNGSCIPRGCILGNGSVVGSNISLPEYTRLFTRKGDTLSDAEKKHDDIVGADGTGVVWDPSELNPEEGNDLADDASDDDIVNPAVNVVHAQSIGSTEETAWKLNLWRNVPEPELNFSDDEDNSDGISGDGSDLEDVNDHEDAAADAIGKRSGAGGDISSRKHLQFTENLIDLVISGKTDNTTAENILTEIKTCKFAHDKSYADCLGGVIPALLSLVLTQTAPAHQQIQVMTALQTLLKVNGWGYVLLKKLIQSPGDEMVVIELVEREVLKPACANSLYPIFRIILQILHTSELLSDEVLGDWIDERESEEEKNSPRGKLFREEKVQEFVEWLREEVEEEDEEDEESEESGDDDEEDA